MEEEGDGQTLCLPEAAAAIEVDVKTGDEEEITVGLRGDLDRLE